MPRFDPEPGAAPGRRQRCAVLLVNLGTPQAPTPAAVRRYLAEFLIDPRVIELPRWLWWPLLNGLILPLRSGRSAHAYASIWSERGSPLAVHTADLATAVSTALGPGIDVAWAMRYGEPAIASVLRRLRSEASFRRLLVLPLYPQFSATTTASVFDALTAELRTWRWPPELRFINDYWREDAWQTAVADSVRTHWRTHGRGQRLLFSFHGIPQRYADAGDPYGQQCRDSAQQIADRLALTADDWQLCFQSRVGREPWLRPYTEQIVRDLPGAGVRSLDVVCPGFAVDCLETLEEIAIRNRAAFQAAGGEELRYISALNGQSDHGQVLAGLLRRHGQGWPEFAGDAASAVERLP